MTAPAPGSHARNIAWSLAGNVVAPAMALGTAPILAQGLGVDGRGELSAATAPLLLATAVGAFGLPESVIHHTAKQFGGARRTATMGLGMISVLGIIAALLIYALAGPLSAGNDELKMLIQVTSAAVGRDRIQRSTIRKRTPPTSSLRSGCSASATKPRASSSCPPAIRACA